MAEHLNNILLSLLNRHDRLKLVKPKKNVVPMWFDAVIRRALIEKDIAKGNLRSIKLLTDVLNFQHLTKSNKFTQYLHSRFDSALGSKTVWNNGNSSKNVTIPNFNREDYNLYLCSSCSRLSIPLDPPITASELKIFIS